MSRIKNKEITGFFVLDALMIFLLVINLFWIIFDWMFEYQVIRGFLYGVAPGFTDTYESVIHPRFILIDLVFVAIFLAEFFIRWISAVYHRIYHRWFFFPFIHFYDLLGCIPIGGFRFLRLLRVISITYRLQRAGIIDLSKSPPFAFSKKYYGIMIEELSDRVTLNILSDIQLEVRHGGPVVDRIINEVIIPHRDSLMEWASHRIQIVASENYERYRSDIQDYVRERITLAVDENKEFSRLEHIPFFGSAVRNTIEKAISDIVFHVVNGIIQDLASQRNRMLINEVADILFDAIMLREQDSEVNRMVTEAFDQSLEIIKCQVRVQHWKLRDLAGDEEEFHRLLREELLKAETRRSS